jgi:16S rRNA (guanine527-N7)-methyltransferase
MNDLLLSPPDGFDEALQTMRVSISDAEKARFGRFLELLYQANQRMNLTAIREPAQAWRRHVLESLAWLGHLDDVKNLADVGSGGGLPGMVLAIARPELSITLIEATGKKARFLREAAEQLQLANVTVVNDRAENVGQDRRHRQRYDRVAARAVGPMRVLLELTLPLVKTGGRLLAMKGAQVAEELRDAGDALMLLGGGQVELYEALPGLDDEAVLVEVVKDQATPRQYPRRPGMPKQQPL